MPERYLLYKGFESGFNNDLMSLELAVGIAWVTKRILIYYGTAGPNQHPTYCRGGRYEFIPESRRNIINNTVRPNILDLVDHVPVPCMILSEFKTTTAGKHLETTDCAAHLHESVFCPLMDFEEPERKKLLENFSEERTWLVDPKSEIFHLGNVNLGYYSRFFLIHHLGSIP
ncbi:hypothetical protein SAMN02745166_00335 [Prosthecobacter debontii]|uniref:Uncharacterized protein n=1 Tax=Prosthecobacter debontii TaxID=48467 RepID=A0A1T4WIQ8_9BACT|nr:hypothetical protein [Prosthecobacter debontii]SKA77210.1 hypothetical protein SAMN02745166_00335 [Prosthecobacter debontii]